MSDEVSIKIKDPKKVKQGKQNRAKGQRFEHKVMHYMESTGWICARWTKNVGYDEGNDLFTWEGGLKLVNSKQGNFRLSTTGFPDFICFRLATNLPEHIIGVECKGGDYKHNKLDKMEKAKAMWLLENHIFSELYIAHKGDKRGEIVLEEFIC